MENRRSYSFELNDKDMFELVKIANSKDTSLADYSNIFEIYASRFGLGMRLTADYMGNKFTKIFTESGYLEQHYKQNFF